MPTPALARRRAVARLAAAVLVCATACGAQISAAAAESAPSHGASAAQPPLPAAGQLERWVEQSAAATWSSAASADPGSRPDAGSRADAAGPAPGMRVEVRLGRLNAGLQQSECKRVEPFLPPNARLWGRSHIGVRCVEGGSWSTLVPVTVSVYGPALVASVPMSTGSIPDAENFRTQEIEWTRSPAVPVADPAMLGGRTLGRPLSAGQVLYANDLRIPQTVAAGDPVRIRVIGEGFSVSASGFAMAGAGEGQSLRVRTEAGRMLVGTVRERSVEVRF